MIYLKNLENDEYLKAYQACLGNRGGNPEELNEVLELSTQRKSMIHEAEQAKAEQNRVGTVIAQKKKAKEDASTELQEMQSLSKKAKELDRKSKDLEEDLTHKLSVLPNLCDESVPVGKSEEDNVVVETVGVPHKFSFKAKPHEDLGVALGIFDFERAAKVAGSRFSFLVGAGAKLERALTQFMIDSHTEEHGYTEIVPPYIVNSDSLYGTGNFPKFQEEVFSINETDYFLIPTAEVPVTNLYRGEILKEKDLPVKYAAFSSCFRSEAGSYGQDTKGLIRQHQFEKVELMSFVHPEESEAEHERLTSHAENILKKLELPYRKVALCTGDISFGAAKCYDLEVWLPGQEAYREISSCSNFKDFQARRANIRFRSESHKKPQFVHTLNGSGLALGRTMVAILENYQNEDGSVRLPQALQKYFGAEVIS